MRAGEKFRIDYLKFDHPKKRAFAGMSSIEKADVTLRVSSVLAELAEDNFWAVCFNFAIFPKTNIISSFYSLVLQFRTIIAAI